MKTRLYEVTLDGEDTRLVNAASAAQAIRHCAVDRFRVSVAKTIDVAVLMSKGTVVENVAGETDHD